MICYGVDLCTDYKPFSKQQSLQTFSTNYNWYVLNCSYSTTILYTCFILLRILSCNNNTAVTKTRHHTNSQPKLVNNLTNCYLY